MSSVHTPLGSRGPGSPRRGTGLFLIQRVTAIILLALAFAYIIAIVTLRGADFEAVRDHIANPLVAIPLLVFVLAGVWHMCFGMQVVIEDYVPSKTAKLVALTCNVMVSIAIAIACIWAVLKIGFAL